MSSINYKLFNHVVSQLDTNSLFVEIGSDRGSGSTQYLSNLARTTQNTFISVDVDPIFFGPLIQTAHMSGEQFVSTLLPTMGKSVSLVYLDNVDWLKQPQAIRKGAGSADEYNLISEYERLHNVNLNNVTSSIAHLKQIAGLLPFMDDKAVVLLEQTSFNASLDVFTGKGGAAVYLLLTEGFKLLSASWKENYILMGRNISAPELPNLNLERLNKRQLNPASRSDTILYDNVV